MWASRILLLVPQLILVPYLLGTIGESGYGIYALVWSLIMSLEQLQVSLQQGVIKYSAGFLAQGRMDEVNKVVSSSFVYSVLLAVVACAGTLVTAAFYKDPTSQIGSALVVVGIMLLFIVPLTPYMAVIQSRQRYYVGALAETISKYVSLLAVVVWFEIVGPSVEALIIIMAGMLFLSRLAQVPIAHRLVPGLQNRPRLFNGMHFRLIAAFGAVTVLVSLCLAANSTGVRWLMDLLVSTRFVAHLAIMLMPAMLLSQLISALSITVMPATSAYEATGNLQMLQELLIRGIRYTTILALAGLLAAAPLMRNVMSVWVGPEYVFLAPFALALFAGEAFIQTTGIAHHMLKGLGKLRVVVFIYSIGLVILPIGLILIVFKIWHNPYIAVTLGLTAGQLVCGCLNIGFCANAVHASLREVFIRAYAQPLLVAAVVCLAAFGSVTMGGINGFTARISVSVLSVLLFLGSCYFYIATAAEQRQVKGLAQAISKRSTVVRRMGPTFKKL